jgi:uncharacterized Tic20 family protein
MTDDRKVIVPTSVDSPTQKIHLTASDLARLNQVPDGMMPGARPVVINVVQQDPPADRQYRGDDLLRRFVPYFVITMMGLVIVGGLAAILGLVVPVIMAGILSIVASFVSIIMSLVLSIIAGVVIALGIAYCQTVNIKNKGR